MRMSALEALETYTLLTVGDGLVSQIPALLISTGTGIVVTRAASHSSLGADILSQLTARPRALVIVAGILLLFALVPGLPKLSFLLAGILSALVAYTLRQAPEKPAETRPEPAPEPDDFASLLAVDTLSVEIGYGLVALVDETISPRLTETDTGSAAGKSELDSGRHPQDEVAADEARPASRLLTRITNIRRQMAQDLGILVPPIHIRDNVELSPNEYVIRIHETIVARGEVFPHRLLAMSTTEGAEALPGTRTTEPVFGLPAFWITEAVRPVAEARGYTVVDASTVIATHLSETLKRHAHEILSHQDVQELIDHLRESHPALVKELIPDLATVSDVQKVLQGLLREGVPIRNLPVILEAIADGARAEASTDEIVELARASLARTITGRLQDADGTLHVITLSPELEQRILDDARQIPGRSQLVRDPQTTQTILKGVSDAAERMTISGREPVLLVSPKIRLAVRRLLERSMPHIAVLSHMELPPDIHIRAVATVNVPLQEAAVG